MAYTLESIREIVSLHKGSKISYRAANGRRKIEERTGIIKETYPSLFTVFIESQQSTISFSYTDLLTKEVELQLEPSVENLF
ncbi:Veg family protein [Cloacibacillus evryensis]|uniref:Veg family protein n=1 Tax=Cloacibacillus evryensis TaxID=508460 RepID=UPI003AB35019